MSDKIQETAENLTRNEILLNVSQLVSELYERLGDQDFSGACLTDVMIKDDWETPIEEYVMSEVNSEDLCVVLERLGEDPDEFPFSSEDQIGIIRSRVYQVMEAAGSDCNWREIVEDLGLEPHEEEALEHWAVTDRLADDLEEQGEMVLKDFMGLNIWGRTCSGQAISDDGAMRRVAADLIERTSNL